MTDFRITPTKKRWTKSKKGRQYKKNTEVDWKHKILNERSFQVVRKALSQLIFLPESTDSHLQETSFAHGVDGPPCHAILDLKTHIQPGREGNIYN